jgi:DNA-binding transcriptional ArsR family regulator
MTSGDRSPEVFAALADPTRRRVLDHLSRAGPASATELAAELPVSRQAVAKHLAQLEAAGLVAGERSGRERRFRLTPGPMADAVSWMAEVGSEWDRRLDSLRARFRRPGSGPR